MSVEHPPGSNSAEPALYPAVTSIDIPAFLQSSPSQCRTLGLPYGNTFMGYLFSGRCRDCKDSPPLDWDSSFFHGSTRPRLRLCSKRKLRRDMLVDMICRECKLDAVPALPYAVHCACTMQHHSSCPEHTHHSCTLHKPRKSWGKLHG